MRMTRRRRKVWRKKQKKNHLPADAPNSRIALRHRREEQHRQLLVKRSVACMTAGSVGLMTLLPSRLQASGALQPWTQAQDDMEQVSQASHTDHEKNRLEKKKRENARAQQEAEKKLAEAERYAADCEAKLYAYESNRFHTQLAEERRAYWQQESKRAAEARDRAEIDLTDKQVEGLEIERRWQLLQHENCVETGVQYTSWSGKDKGSQAVLPVKASYQKDDWSLKARGGFLSQDKGDGSGHFSSLLDTELAGSVTAYRAGPRSMQYLLDVSLPTGRKISADRIIPAGLGSTDYLHRGWEMTPGLAFSYHYTPEDILTARLDFSFAAPYEAPEWHGWQAGLHPGRRFRQSVAYQHNGSTNHYMLRAMHESEEKTSFGNASYRPGDRIFLGFYGERYVSDRDALQMYGVTFRQTGGSYDISLPVTANGRYSGTIYGLGWRHEVSPDLQYYLRAAYMKTDGTHIDPARYLLQKDMRRWQGSFSIERRLAENMQLQAELAYYKQKDHWQGDFHGYQCSIMLKKEF